MSELRKVLEEALRLERESIPGVLATLVDAGGSTPRHDVARMVVHTDGTVVGTIGGGALEHEMVRRSCEEVLPSGEPLLAQTDLEALGMTCGGRVQVLLEPIGLQPKVILFGAGHVAAEVAPLAAHCGFAVFVVDDRRSLASAERFPDAAALVCSFDPADWQDLPLGPGGYGVVVTRGHQHDYEVVRAIIERSLTYVGMMGSKKKVAEVRARLADDGLAEELISRIHAPIGLPMRCETPAEIAVSIVGQLVDAWRSSTAAASPSPAGPTT